jgi:hypothetical protein
MYATSTYRQLPDWHSPLQHWLLMNGIENAQSTVAPAGRQHAPFVQVPPPQQSAEVRH